MSDDPHPSPVHRTADQYPLPDSVSISNKSLTTFANVLTTDPFTPPDWDSPLYPEAGVTHTLDQTLDFFLVGNAITFTPTDDDGNLYETKYDGTTWKGNDAIWAALRQSLDSNDSPDMLSAGTLADLSHEQFHSVFSPDSESLSLTHYRVRNLRDIGNGLLHQYNGNTRDLIESGGNRLYYGGRGVAERMLGAFPTAYALDSETADRWALTFDARLNTALRMMQDYAFTYDERLIWDADSIAMPATPEFAAILHDAGVLQFNAELEERLQAGEYLEPWSEEERGIRAATVRAGERLRTAVNARREGAYPNIPMPAFASTLRELYTDEMLTYRARTTAY